MNSSNPKNRSQNKIQSLVEDWLDGDQTSNERRKKRDTIKVSRERFLDPSKANATVIEVFPKFCNVRLDHPDARVILCHYKRARLQVSQKEQYKERSPVAVGDRVLVSLPEKKHGVVLGLCQRSSTLSRPAPGHDHNVVHVIASNIDLMVIVASVHEPEFSQGLVDRFLIASQISEIEPILCVNKVDLMSSEDKKQWEVYSDLGIKYFEMSVKENVGIDNLKNSIANRHVVFCGHSGVGKTSLLSSLIQQDVGKVGQVSSHSKKGKHTTTSSKLVFSENDEQWIDTPGVKNFRLIGVTLENLSSFFPEMISLDCQKKGCNHYQQENCQAKELIRYESYIRIYESIIEEQKLRRKKR